MLQFGKYKLVQPLGKGGMAQVWLAHKESAAGAVKVCAVKFPRDIFSDNDSEREALFREARVAMLLNHSNIVQVNDLGFVGSLPYVELERIDGIDLSALNDQMRLFGMPFSFSLAAYILQEILEALAYAHTFSIDGKPQHIVHRDVSPQNVLCSTAGEVKLMDFGIAAAASEHSSGMHARGKLRYMAPEHLAAKAVPQSDLFAAGAMFWEMLEGKKFRHDTPFDDMRIAVLKHSVPALTRPDVPRELQRLCRELLEPDLRKRVATAEDALKLLRLWPASTSERAGLRALLAQHRVTRRSGMTHADIAIPPWLAAALKEINVEAGGGAIELPVAPVRDSDVVHAPPGVPSPLARDDDAPVAMRKRSSLVMPTVDPRGDVPASERTSRLDQADLAAARGERTELLDGGGLRSSATDQGIGQSMAGSRDSVPVAAASRVSFDAETATATAFDPSQPARRGMWIGLAVFVLAIASLAAWAVVTLLGQPSAPEVAAKTPAPDSPKAAPTAPVVDEPAAKAEPTKVELPPEPSGPSFDEPAPAKPEPTAAPVQPQPTIAEPTPPATPPPVAAPEPAPTPEPVAAPSDAPAPAPTAKPSPAPKPRAAKKDVTVKVRLMLVDYAELKLGSKTIVVAPSADVKVPAGKTSVKWRLSKDEPWRASGAIVLGEGLAHVVRIGSSGPKHASSPEGP
jgi:serine/threonine protein kinase